MGLAAASASAASSTSKPRAAASATPYAPAMPSSGAPRTASVRIACTRAGASVHTSSTSSPGSLVWSRRTTHGPLGRARPSVGIAGSLVGYASVSAAVVLA